MNMMGWVEKEKAEFIFVVFTTCAEHHMIIFSILPSTLQQTNLSWTKLSLKVICTA